MLGSCYKEILLEENEEWSIKERVLEFDHVYAFTDLEDHMLLYTLPSDTLSEYSPYVSFGDYESIEFDGISLRENEKNDLGEVVVNHPYTITAHSGNKIESFQLYFTNLPLLHIHSESKIRDEPKVVSWMEIAYTREHNGLEEINLFSTYAGIEIRGRTSAVHEKKSYGLELWENPYGNDRSAALLGMRYGEDWILDAMYVDPLRMRNKLSFEIWEKIWKEKRDTPFKTSIPGIQSEYIELFINQRYMGLYCLTEKIDENLLVLPPGNSGSEGVIYKAIDWKGGATAFETYNSEPGTSLIWEGWEQIYPDALACWEPLAELRKSVVFDEDELFEERIDELFDLTVAAEYYLFTNLLLAHDNIIKNYYLARYPEESHFLLIPWDLEGSWGIMWDGDESSTNGILENTLYTRLLDLEVNDFDELLESKWEHYRETIFQKDSLLVPAINYADLLYRSGAIERENNRWEKVEIDIDQELLYFSQWTSQRLDYLDLVFD
jgi:hypothetical protein